VTTAVGDVVLEALANSLIFRGNELHAYRAKSKGNKRVVAEVSW
jgi:hypothetical protein